MLEPGRLDAIEVMVERFAEIGKQHMQDLPIYNPSLHVEAIGFQSCTEGLIGVLITPWFVNIMLLPENVDQWQAHELGTRHLICLPSGEQEFFLGEDEAFGRYLFRTVKSPTHCFKQQGEAQVVAQRALQGLIMAERDEQLLQGTQQVKFTSETQKPVGRREFMRNFFSPADQ